jgi:hypothetical protein
MSENLILKQCQGAHLQGPAKNIVEDMTFSSLEAKLSPAHEKYNI